MRLIDADELRKNMFDYAPPEMKWDRGDIEHKIGEMPTIDAIPISWIKEHINWLKSIDNGFAKMSAMNIETLLKEWMVGSSHIFKSERKDDETH